MQKITKTMDAFFSLEELAKKNTPVHALHPASKLTVTLVFILCVISSGRYDVAGLTVYFFYPALLTALGELPIRSILTRTLPALPFVLFAGVSNILFERALAPIGVFALGYALSVKAGVAAFGGLIHYVLILSGVGVSCLLLGLLLAWLVVGISLPRFVRAMVPTLAVAISTQSSLASLPAMLKSSEELGVDPKKADIVLPLAVALFRFTSPAMNLAVVVYVAWLFGVELTPWEMAVGLGVALAAALSSVSLPGSISFVTSIAPIAVSMGVPVAPLGLLVAVETFPDIFRTLGNVVGDVAATKFAADGVETAEPTGETP